MSDVRSRRHMYIRNQLATDFSVDMECSQKCLSGLFYLLAQVRTLCTLIPLFYGKKGNAEKKDKHNVVQLKQYN